MKYFLSAILIFVALVAKAQPLVMGSQKCYGGSDYDGFNRILKTDTGFIIIGTTSSTDGMISQHFGESDMVVMWLDSAKNFIRSRSYGGYQMEIGTKVIDTHNGYLYVGGSTFSTNNFPDYHGRGDMVLIKTDSIGNQIWEKCYGGSGGEDLLDIVLKNGFLYLVGMSNSSDGDVTWNHGYDDIWVVKTDLEGSIIWQKTYGGFFSETAFHILPQEDGFVLTGNSDSSNGDIDCNQVMYDLNGVVMKIDTSGNLIWVRCFGGTMRDYLVKTLATPDSGYICFGGTESVDSSFSTNHGSWDGLIIKLDKNLNIEWQKLIGGSFTEQFQNAFITSDGNYLLLLMSSSHDGQVYGNNSNGQHEYFDAWMVKMDQSGNIMWSECFGGESNDDFEDLIESPPGSFTLLGNTPTGESGNVDCTHFLYDDGWIVSLRDTTATNYVIEKNPRYIKVYPNPSSHGFEIDLSDVHGNRADQLFIFDETGSLVATLPVSKSEDKIFWMPLHKGIYLLKCNKTFESVKLISF